jgi:hypothetical protein
MITTASLTARDAELARLSHALNESQSHASDLSRQLQQHMSAVDTNATSVIVADAHASLSDELGESADALRVQIATLRTELALVGETMTVCAVIVGLS